MSTYIYLECLDHDPLLRAVEESGQHERDLPSIIGDIENRELLSSIWDNGWRMPIPREVTGDRSGYFVKNSAMFLSQHKGCNIGVVDQYGDRYSLEGFPNSDLPEEEFGLEALQAEIAYHITGDDSLDAIPAKVVVSENEESSEVSVLLLFREGEDDREIDRTIGKLIPFLYRVIFDGGTSGHSTFTLKAETF